MDSLRESIEEAVFEEATVMHSGGEAWLDDIGKAPERIIAVFEAVLLSDEVVEESAKALHERHWIDGWDSESEDNKRYYLEDAKAALQAALAAAKGTEGSE